MEIFDPEATDLSDDDEIPVFETIGLKGVSNKRIANEDEKANVINDVEAAALDSDAKMTPDDSNKKSTEPDDFVAMEMSDLETTDIGDDGELPWLKTIGLEDVNDKRIENEDEKACDINDVEVELLDAEGENEPDDCNAKCIELDDFVVMEMFDIETIDLDDDELSVFENKDEEACSINDVKAAFFDIDGEIDADDFNDKCINLDDVVAMGMFDLERTDLSDDYELLVFETIGLEGVNDNRIANEDEEAYGINDVEAAILNSDAKMTPDDSNGK